MTDSPNESANALTHPTPVTRPAAPGPDTTTELLLQRAMTHGDFDDVARFAQTFKSIVQDTAGYSLLSAAQRESLDMIGSKLGRILSGDPNHTDHWLDIAGYARLSADRCKP